MIMELTILTQIQEEQMLRRLTFKQTITKIVLCLLNT